MNVSYAIKQNTLYITLSGDMDDYSVPAARRSCDRTIDDNLTCDRVVFDLSGVQFMDSTGIGFLIGRYKKCKRLSIPLSIQNPNLSTDKILSLSGIYSLIPRL